MAQTANSVALITGANKGIGLEIARQLGKQGITVIIGARDPQKGAEAVSQLKAEGIDAHTVKLEVSNHDDIAALPAWFEQNTGRLDILVNNAGVFPDLQGVTPQGFRDGYETNVIAPFFLTQNAPAAPESVARRPHRQPQQRSRLTYRQWFRSASK